MLLIVAYTVVSNTCPASWLPPSWIEKINHHICVQRFQIQQQNYARWRKMPCRAESRWKTKHVRRWKQRMLMQKWSVLFNIRIYCRYTVFWSFTLIGPTSKGQRSSQLVAVVRWTCRGTCWTVWRCTWTTSSPTRTWTRRRTSSTTTRHCASSLVAAPTPTCAMNTTPTASSTTSSSMRRLATSCRQRDSCVKVVLYCSLHQQAILA